MGAGGEGMGKLIIARHALPAPASKQPASSMVTHMQNTNIDMHVIKYTSTHSIKHAEAHDNDRKHETCISHMSTMRGRG